MGAWLVADAWCGWEALGERFPVSCGKPLCSQRTVGPVWARCLDAGSLAK
jgi:hypothetical protein